MADDSGNRPAAVAAQMLGVVATIGLLVGGGDRDGLTGKVVWIYGS